jgi:hypothetical protein
MKRIVLMFVFVMSVVCAPAHAQDDRTVVNFSDPSRPGLVKVVLFNAGIIVRSYTGKEVIIESRSGRNRARPRVTTDGLRRIDAVSRGLNIEEENNVLTIDARNPNEGDLEIQVPARTNLSLRTQNGQIQVDGVDGEIEATTQNGTLRLTNVAGAVVAHASNGSVIASLREVTANKPMSFTSQNSSIDLTLPATVKANLRLRTINGDAYTDFDLQLQPNAAAAGNDSRNGTRGRPRAETDRTVVGAINGGGPDIDVRTLNGNIFIRKAK